MYCNIYLAKLYKYRKLFFAIDMQNPMTDKIGLLIKLKY